MKSLMEFYDRSMHYFSHHVTANSMAHFLAGFGIAVLLQYYMRGDSLIPVLVAWIFVLISVAIHLLSILKLKK